MPYNLSVLWRNFFFVLKKRAARLLIAFLLTNAGKFLSYRTSNKILKGGEIN